MKISVVMITYLHENYISDAITSVFNQKGDFEIELIVANDNSPDHTDLIIRKFIKRCPGNFSMKYLKRENNMGMMANFLDALSQATGNYVALCDGDDYWTDPLKLKKQVDFLENNVDYVLSFTKSKEFYQDKHVLIETKYPLYIDNLDFHDLLVGDWFIRTATIVFVRDRLNLDFLKRLEYSADYFIQLLLMNEGKFHFLNETTSVYRRHRGGISNSSKDLFLIRRVWFCDNLILFNKHTNYKYNEIILIRIKQVEIEILDFAFLNLKVKYFYLIKVNNLRSITKHFVKRINNKFF